MTLHHQTGILGITKWRLVRLSVLQAAVEGHTLSTTAAKQWD